MVSLRRSREEGHARKFLVVIDDTPECDRALTYAAKRAERTGGGLVLLYVIVPSDFQHWLGVENIMRAEAREAAEQTLDTHVERLRGFARVEPELVIREGGRAEEIVALIDADEDIAILVLAASTDKEGPGPLVTALAGKGAGTFPVPLTIVPGTLTDAEIEAVA